MEKWNIRKNKMLPVIFALAWPTMLEQLMQTAVQYMDTGMVGVLGTRATAAVGATSTVNWGSRINQHCKLADRKYSISDWCRIACVYIAVIWCRKSGTRKKGVRTGCFSSACGRNQFYYRDCSNQQAGASLDAGR